MDNDTIHILGPGKVFFDYGPVHMVVTAFENDTPMTDLCTEAFSLIERTLSQISLSLPILRLPPPLISLETMEVLQGPALKMIQAVQGVGDPSLTPMATVAGVMSDTVADWLVSQGATRVLVNNGGDIALRLAPNETVRVGLISDLAKGNVDQIVEISAQDQIGGIATSGLGGGSFTRGIANAVTVFAKTSSQADALATHLANQTYIASDQVLTTKAGAFDPMSDIADLEVVVSVGQLSQSEVNLSLENLYTATKQLYAKDLFLGMYANVQNQCVYFPDGYFKTKLKGDESYGT